ncbi:hypothetical protein V8C43DRAFT_309405 [Trichoderma afarasin]
MVAKGKQLGDSSPPDPVGFDGVTVKRLNRRNGARTSDLRRATAGQHPSHQPGRATCTARLDWLACFPTTHPLHCLAKSVMVGRVTGMTFPFCERHVVDNSAGVGITMSLCAGGLVDVDAVG